MDLQISLCNIYGGYIKLSLCKKYDDLILYDINIQLTHHEIKDIINLIDNYYTITKHQLQPTIITTETEISSNIVFQDSDKKYIKFDSFINGNMFSVYLDKNDIEKLKESVIKFSLTLC